MKSEEPLDGESSEDIRKKAIDLGEVISAWARQGEFAHESRHDDILQANLCPDHPDETDCQFRVTDTWRGWVIDCTHEGCDHFVEYDAAEGE